MSATTTKAMRAWCRALLDPKNCTLKRSPRTWSISISGFYCGSRPNYVMVDNLEQAGLIRFDKDAENHEVASLTDAGKAIAA